jgi:hypothetical protein
MQIQELVGGLDTSTSFAAFDKMEEKVLQLEAEAESTAVLIGSDSLEGQFQQLEGGNVNDELDRCAPVTEIDAWSRPMLSVCPQRSACVKCAACKRFSMYTLRRVSAQLSDNTWTFSDSVMPKLCICMDTCLAYESLVNSAHFFVSWHRARFACRMKKTLTAGTPAAPSSTAASSSRPRVRDAIDMELEALRQKVKE